MLLGGCLVAGGIVSRFGQSPMLGYLLAGMLLGGPGSFHLVGSEHEIEAIAELGVALLLFGIGLEFSWRRLRSLGGAALAAGAAQVVLTCAGGALVSAVFGLGAIEAFAVGAMIALSSTAAVLRVLMDRATSWTARRSTAPTVATPWRSSSFRTSPWSRSRSS